MFGQLTETDIAGQKPEPQTLGLLLCWQSNKSSSFSSLSAFVPADVFQFGF